MVFNSFEFVIFLLIAFLVYWKLSHKGQNIFLVIASYVFYGWWDWRFLLLMLASTLVDFITSVFIDLTERQSRRKTLLFISIFINLGILGFFKYFNFFVTSLQDALMAFGINELSLETLNIVLPVGISFYTFQTLGYVIDVYRKQIKPTKNLIEFMGFVSFFPQLVAGPIERASNLLGQFQLKRIFNYPLVIDGCRQILWGFFKKMVIADSLAGVVDNIYTNSLTVSGWHLALATFFFAFQIYCDFSGYSDIALGVARLFGFRLTRNFHFPFFSKNIIQFWQRWHITLASWLRDYAFIPLSRWGGHQMTLIRYARNVLITFGISGLWHGANWTFVLWGLLHGAYFIPYAIFKNRFKKTPETGPSLRDLHQIILTFFLVFISWILFRSESVAQAFFIFKKIFLDLPNLPALGELYPKRLLLIGVFILVEWIQRNKEHPLQLPASVPGWLKWLVYYAILVLILLFGNFDYIPFIYFQF